MAWTAVILTSAAGDYPPIRSLLGVSSTELPDATIEQSPFLPTAEAIVKQGLTTYATIISSGGDNLQLLKAGVQALAAVLLCPKLEYDSGQSWQVGDYKEGGSKVDWRGKAKELLEQAKQALGAISTRTWTRRTLVAVAGPTRSGSNVPDDLEQWIERIVPRVVDWIEEGGEDDSWSW